MDCKLSFTVQDNCVLCGEMQAQFPTANDARVMCDWLNSGEMRFDRIVWERVESITKG